jgi:hemolysin III
MVGDGYWPSDRPSLRGVSHQLAFFVSVVVGAALVVSATGARAHAAAVLFAVPVALMFGASALYHRVAWRPAARLWMRRVDHAAILLVIGGSYTAFGLFALDGVWQSAILAVVWSGVAAAILLRIVWVNAPGWLAASIAIALGWISVIVAPQILSAIGVGGLALLLCGGLLYTAGGVVYAMQRPDPFPAKFGFHEVFHLLVIAAVACHYASVGFFLLPDA